MNATSTNTTGGGLNNGTATAAPTGGTAPYTYLWSNQATTATINNLAPNVYTVTVTDANGCIKSSSVNVVSVDNTAPVITCPASYQQCDEGFPINYPLPQATDNSGGQPTLSLVSGLPNGAGFPLGITTQVFQATDSSGNTADGRLICTNELGIPIEFR